MSNAAANRVVEVTTNTELTGKAILNAVALQATGGAGTVEIWARFAPGQTKVRIATISAASGVTFHQPFYCAGMLDPETREIANARVYFHFA
jgi:hypothetical protein